MTKRRNVKIQKWLALAGSVVGILAIISVMADGFSLLDRLKPTSESVPGGAVQVDNNNGVVIGSNAIISGNIAVNPQPILPTQDPQLYDVQIEGQNNEVIVAYNKSRSVIWQDKLDTKIQSVIVADMNNDGNQEAVVATTEPGENPGWLYVYSHTGDLIAKQNLWQPSIYYGGAKSKVNVHDIRVADLINDGVKEIIVIVGDIYWYASRISVLQLKASRLEEIGSYWNPGQLRKLYIADMNNDGVQEIACIGENNDLQRIYPLSGNVFVALLLDGSQIKGQAPPGIGNASKGSDLWYMYLTPSSMWITEADFEDVDGDGRNDIQISFSDSCSYYLDYHGKIVGRGNGSSCKGESTLHFAEQ